MTRPSLFALAHKARAALAIAAFAVMVNFCSEALAQSESDRKTLEGLVEMLKGITEEAGEVDILGLGMGMGKTQLNRARETAAKIADQRDEALNELEDSAPRSFAESLAIDNVCRGTANEEEIRILSLLGSLSRLEQDYCRRLESAIFQIGYEVFENKIETKTLNIGSVSDDFVLGVGDKLIVTFIGTTSKSSTVVVDKEGMLSVGDLPPLAAAGRTLGELKRELDARTRSAFVGTEVFTSLGAVREIGILVVGEVRRPGAHRVTSLSSVVDALSIAGGIKKTGTLRNLSLRRGTESIPIDLYDVFFGGGESVRELMLQEGDRIVVPTIGLTAAISGEVIRPGIVEISPSSQSIELNELLGLAGGVIRPAGNVFTQVRFDEFGLQTISEVAPEALLPRAGNIIIVSFPSNLQSGGVHLAGSVRLPGRRSLAAVPTVGALIGSRDALSDDPYLLMGILETADPRTATRRFFALNLANILDGVEDFNLKEGDRLIVLGRDDVRALSSPNIQQAIRGRLQTKGILTVRSDDETTLDSPASLQAIRAISQQLERTQLSAATSPEVRNRGTTEGRCNSTDQLARLVSESPQGRFSNAILNNDPRQAQTTVRANDCIPIYEEIPNLLPFVLEHSTLVSGEVRQPGVYPATGANPLSTIVSAAGGLTRDADLSRVEISKLVYDRSRASTEVLRDLVDLSTANALQQVILSPGDIVRFNKTFADRDTGPVFLSGEFVRPGTYDIRRGERLSAVIARAGGVTRQAYPFGAIFTREGVRRAEASALKELSRQFNSAIAVAAAEKGASAGSLSSVLQVSSSLQQTEAVGRVVIEADPTVLQIRPELDLVLQPGDRLFMAKRPNSVLVVGEVLSPGAKQFVAGTAINTYIRQSGGFQRAADQKRIYVLFPNGAAQPVSVSAFQFTPIRVPPGSTIVVPRDATPFNIFTFASEIASVLSQLAITAASLAVISSN